MSEKLVIVPRRISVGHKAATILFFVLTCLSLVAAMLVAPTLFLIPAIIFGVLWYVFGFRSYTEYEYTYFDGEFRIAKIKNKSRRKKVALVNMDDVLMIAAPTNMRMTRALPSRMPHQEKPERRCTSSSVKVRKALHVMRLNRMRRCWMRLW